MKTYHLLVLVMAIFVLNSCIVRSLYPFYTKDTISFKREFLGVWEDDSDPSSQWIIGSIKDYYQEERKYDSLLLSPKEKEDYNMLMGGYVVITKQKNDVAIFIAMPFKINNQLFLDFKPFTSSCHCGVDLVEYHNVVTHSLVKFDVLNNNRVSIKWFSSKKMKSLFDNNKINIKHEKYDSEYLITASSEELQKFIAKYMVSNETEKWKTDVAYNLKRTGSEEESLQYLKKMISGKEKIKGIDLN